jgi:hypothetical protein
LTIKIKIKGVPAWIKEDTTPSPFFGMKTIIIEFRDEVNGIVHYFGLEIPDKNHSRQELIKVVKKEAEEKLGDFIISLKRNYNKKSS